jgi:hypothetical protein
MYRVLVRKPEGNNLVEDLGVDGRIILKSIFKNWYGAWTGLRWLMIGAGRGSFVNSVMNLPVP